MKKKWKVVSRSLSLVEHSSCAFDAAISYGIKDIELQISAGLSCAASHKEELKLGYVNGKLAVEESWYGLK